MGDSIGADRRAGAQVAREDWLNDGVLSGFIATFAMTVVLIAAYGLASVLGVEGDGGFGGWFWALTHNPLTDRTADAVVVAIALNLIMGLILALVYARFVEPALTGPGWRKGMLFSLIPWALSVLAFLPLLGGGMLGFDIGAGPLPILGNLILHLVYGAVLGGFYAVALEDSVDEGAIGHGQAVSTERGAAIGVIGGLVVGAVAGWFLGPIIAEDAGRAVSVAASALIGAAGGLGVGSFFGMGGRRSRA